MPAPQKGPRPITRLADMPPAQRAGMLSNDEQFQIFAAKTAKAPTKRFSTAATAEFIRRYCGIKSRAEILPGSEALRKFEILRTEFDVARGRIAKPRS